MSSSATAEGATTAPPASDRTLSDAMMAPWALAALAILLILTRLDVASVSDLVIAASVVSISLAAVNYLLNRDPFHPFLFISLYTWVVLVGVWVFMVVVDEPVGIIPLISPDGPTERILLACHISLMLGLQLGLLFRGRQIRRSRRAVPVRIATGILLVAFAGRGYLLVRASGRVYDAGRVQTPIGRVIALAITAVVFAGIFATFGEGGAGPATKWLLFLSPVQLGFIAAAVGFGLLAGSRTEGSAAILLVIVLQARLTRLGLRVPRLPGRREGPQQRSVHPRKLLRRSDRFSPAPAHHGEAPRRHPNGGSLCLSRVDQVHQAQHTFCVLFPNRRNHEPEGERIHRLESGRRSYHGRDLSPPARQINSQRKGPGTLCLICDPRGGLLRFPIGCPRRTHDSTNPLIIISFLGFVAGRLSIE